MRSLMLKYFVKALTSNEKYYYYLPCNLQDLKLHRLILALQLHKKASAMWKGVLLQADLRIRAERSPCLSHDTALGERQQWGSRAPS